MGGARWFWARAPLSSPQRSQGQPAAPGFLLPQPRPSPPRAAPGQRVPRVSRANLALGSGWGRACPTPGTRPPPHWAGYLRSPHPHWQFYKACFRGVHQFKGPAPSGSAGCASSSARPTARSPDQCGSRGSGPAPSALFPTITPATFQPSGHLGVTGSSARSLGAPSAGRMSLKGRPWETEARSPLCHPHTLLQPRRSHAQRTTELHPWQES